jgi:hypothetical protein
MSTGAGSRRPRRDIKKARPLSVLPFFASKLRQTKNKGRNTVLFSNNSGAQQGNLSVCRIPYLLVF